MRRRWLLAAGGASVLGVGTAGATLLPDRTEAAPLPRLLSGPDWYDADPRAESAWLATGRVPGAAGPHGGLVRRALLDLRALTGPDGAVAAGPAPSWAYAWPRDSAFAAAALARTGHLDDADRILRFLARVQLPDGGSRPATGSTGGAPPTTAGVRSTGPAGRCGRCARRWTPTPTPRRRATGRRSTGTCWTGPWSSPSTGRRAARGCPTRPRTTGS